MSARLRQFGAAPTPARASAGEPIRIIRAIARLNMGGPALHVAYLAAELKSRGFRTTLVAGELAHGEGSMSYVAQERGVPIVSVPELHREISPIRDAVAVARLAALIRRERPHILHTHTAKAGTVGRLAALCVPRRQRPLVIHTFHGHVLHGYFGPVRSATFRVLERLLAAGTDVLIAVSPQVRDDLVALGVAPRSRFSVIRLGIELEDRVDTDAGARSGSRRLLGIAPERFVVGWVGRMTGVKRTGDVLAAVQLLQERGVDVALVMVGDGPDRDEVERKAHGLGVARNCFYLGYQREVASWYAAFDVLVLPSANEGTPVVAIEALAAGRPVVASRVGGVPDVVRDGVDGFLVEPGDVVALADRLEQLSRDAGLRERMGAAGRARVLSRYSVERLIDDVERLYRSMLVAPTPASRSSRTSSSSRR